MRRAFPRRRFYPAPYQIGIELIRLRNRGHGHAGGLAGSNYLGFEFRAVITAMTPWRLCRKVHSVHQKLVDAMLPSIIAPFNVVGLDAYAYSAAAFFVLCDSFSLMRADLPERSRR